MEEHVQATKGGKVFYWTNTFRAQRQTLVFLHGLTADHSLFDKQVEYFEKSFNLVTWDAPSHGKSRPYSDFTYPNAAEDLFSILDSLGIDSPILIGQSMGGYIIQSFILRHPTRIKAFIGIDTCPYGEVYYSKSDKWWLRQIEWMSHLYPADYLKKAIAKQCTQTPWAYQNMLGALEPYSKNELCHLMGIGYAGFLEDNRDMNIPCPTLLIVGENDKTGKVMHYCKAWAEAQNLDLKVIKDARHNANADNPEAVNKEISDFIRLL